MNKITCFHQTKNILTDARQQMKKPCWNWIYNSILCSKFSNWGHGQINEQIQEFIVDTTLQMNTSSLKSTQRPFYLSFTISSIEHKNGLNRSVKPYGKYISFSLSILRFSYDGNWDWLRKEQFISVLLDLFVHKLIK